MAQKRNRKTAVVQCAGGCCTGLAVQGGKEAEDDRMQYRDCADAALKLPEDLSLCRWGCLGLGSCVEACRLNAVFINSSGTAEVDRSRCVGCGLCVKACPRHLIRLTGPEFTYTRRVSAKLPVLRQERNVLPDVLPAESV